MEAGISFAVLMGILFAYYRTKDIIKKRLVIGFCLAAGIAAAAISAVIRAIPNFVNRTSLSFWSIQPVVAAMAALLLLIFLRTRISEKNESVFENLFSVFLSIYCIGSFFYYLPAVLTQLNGFVYYGESAVSTAVLFRVIGYAFAILLMLLSAAAVYRNGENLPDRELTAAVVLSLLIRGVTQLAVIVQRLYSLQLIPRRPWIFSGIAWTINHAAYFDFLQFLVIAAVPVLLWKKNLKITEPYQNRAQLRKIRYLKRKRRHAAQFFLILLVMDILSLTAVKSYAGREVPLSAPEDYAMDGNLLVIPIEELEDGHLHRYLYTSADHVEMRCIVIKKAQGSYGVGLDACEICGPSGYFERKDQVVCKLCDVVMNKGTIGFAGGCNPIPFHYIVHDQKIKIDRADLDALSYVFR